MNRKFWWSAACRVVLMCVLALVGTACQEGGSGTSPTTAPTTSAPTDSAPPSDSSADPGDTTSPGTSTPGTDDHHGDQPAATGMANIELQGQASEISTRLGEKKTFTLMVKALGDFIGPVQLSVDKTDLDNLYKAGADIKFMITPSQLTLAANETQTIEVEVNVTSRSPSFKSVSAGGGGHFSVVGQADFGGQAISASMDVPLGVDPTYEVHILKNGVPHTYDQPTRGELSQTEIRNHVGGLTLRFVNYDTAETHVMHGSGLIPHQSTGSPMAKAPVAGEPGGSYVVKVTSTTKATGIYYCHNHESSALQRVILFNADL